MIHLTWQRVKGRRRISGLLRRPPSVSTIRGPPEALRPLSTRVAILHPASPRPSPGARPLSPARPPRRWHLGAGRGAGDNRGSRPLSLPWSGDPDVPMLPGRPSDWSGDRRAPGGGPSLRHRRRRPRPDELTSCGKRIPSWHGARYSSRAMTRSTPSAATGCWSRLSVPPAGWAWPASSEGSERCRPGMMPPRAGLEWWNRLPMASRWRRPRRGPMATGRWSCGSPHPCRRSVT